MTHTDWPLISNSVGLASASEIVCFYKFHGIARDRFLHAYVK